MPLTDSDLNLPVQPINGEPRIRDLDLAVRLGFSDPHEIRRLITRHSSSLAGLGISVTVPEIPEGRGRPGKAHYLNRKQAIFITAKSETAKATEITIEIVERFDAYERGALPAIDANNPAQLRHLLIAYTERVEKVETALAIAGPKAEAYDEFIHRDGELSVDEAAKMLLGWSGQKLFRRLREAGWVDRREGVNTPKLWTIEQQFMVVRPASLPNGRIYGQPKLTAKGCAALRLAIRKGDLFLAAVPEHRLLANTGAPQ